MLFFFNSTPNYTRYFDNMTLQKFKMALNDVTVEAFTKTMFKR